MVRSRTRTYTVPMAAVILTHADVESRLRGTRAAILQLGVRRLALFGSVRRNEARLDSDVDVLVEFEPGQKTFDHLLSLGELLAQTLEHPVELVTAESISPFLRPYILAEAVDVLRAA
jgi:uncharacterized protein